MSYYTAAYSDIRINDDTRFRAQGSWIADQLANIGWTKTADTGQIDWVNVSAPSAANSSQGYEVRSSSQGLYIKIEYGSGAYSYAKGFWLTMGTGSDGAGSITGVLYERKQCSGIGGYTGGAARAGDDFVSGTTTRLMVAVTDDTQSGGYNAAFLLQKTHDASFTEDSEGWWFMNWHYGDGTLFCIGARNIATEDTNKYGLLVLPRSVGDASNIPTLPVFAPHPLYSFVAMRDLYVVPASLVSAQSTATINGRTYVCVGPNSSSANYYNVTMNFAHNLLMRYE